jgi:esterase/lipase superfamily enzyme
LPTETAIRREYVHWFSPNLGHEMELLIFGRSGRPVLLFPTSLGRFYQYEDFSLVGALQDRIESERVQLFCVDSIDAESWYNRAAPPYHRVRRALDYERYIVNEVVPYIASQRPDRATDSRVLLAGCSMGAFHATLIGLRHPEVSNGILALSGVFDNTMFLDGYHDDETYFTNPLAFLPGLTDPYYLEQFRRMEIILVTGAEDPHVEEARRLSELLWSKGVPHLLDIWAGWAHDWPYWYEMARKYL